MASIMEKDVLIELVAFAYVSVCKVTKSQENEDKNRLIDLRHEIYSTPYQALNYEKLCNEVQEIRNKYN
ncbi:hypothetical protein ACWIUH_03040 [Ursidibacter arcticus]